MSKDESKAMQVSICISKALAARVGLKPLRCPPGSLMKLKGCVYSAPLISFLLYGYETWSLRVEDEDDNVDGNE